MAAPRPLADERGTKVDGKFLTSLTKQGVGKDFRMKILFATNAHPSTHG